jgi:hypothetical protein
MRRMKLTAVAILISMMPIANACWAQGPRDVTKLTIEAPVKTLLKSAAPVDAQDFENRKVAPGLVHWHDGFAAACARAKVSGKPVLLFHMMGNLNNEFT